MSRQKERITIADVAAQADVSIMTVSRVLNNKGEISETTRTHVLNVMRDLGYRPNRIARSLATARTLKIGIVVPSISSAYFGSVLEGAERIFGDSGYHMLLCNTAQNTKREYAILELFEEDRVDGVIVLSSHMPQDELTLYLSKQRAAVVLNSDVEAGIAGHVMTNERNSMSLAVNHLLKSGRRHLGYVGHDVPSYAGRERQRSFVATVEEAGLSSCANRMISCDRRDGHMTARQLLERAPEIDGLVCFNDEIAAGALRACLDLGRRVPDDVAVIGYDDIFLAKLLTPSLTTLRLERTKQEVGALVARMLLERIEGSPTQDEVMINHELVVRESAP
ncbi:MAG: LacI family transcriptional regulator [Anaerolineae bacterium]|nr:LacI family transcriptional regulator [Anaerolineae bacterium]